MITRPAEHEFEFTDSEFKRLREIVHLRTGIALSEAKRELVYGRLARRLRKLNLNSFAEYCRLVEGTESTELQELTNAITTNLTSFFREGYHFEQLAKEALPYAESKRLATRRIRLWSAGCSTPRTRAPAAPRAGSRRASSPRPPRSPATTCSPGSTPRCA